MNSIPRFLNFIIDSFIYLILVFILLILTKNVIDKNIMKYFLIFLYYLYYFIFEYYFNFTIGKLITNTRVISTINLKEPSVFQVLIRTVSRTIPFDFIFYLFGFNGLHDIFSKTTLKQC